jgi:hypothetical protein
MRHIPPGQPNARPLHWPERQGLADRSVRQRTISLVTLGKRGLQPRKNRRLIRRIARHRLRIEHRPIQRRTNTKLRLRNMVHYSGKRPNLRRRLELKVRLRHLLRRLQNIRLQPVIRGQHLTRRSKRHRRSSRHSRSGSRRSLRPTCSCSHKDRRGHQKTSLHKTPPFTSSTV